MYIRNIPTRGARYENKSFDMIKTQTTRVVKKSVDPAQNHSVLSRTKIFLGFIVLAQFACGIGQAHLPCYFCVASSVPADANIHAA